MCGLLLDGLTDLVGGWTLQKNVTVLISVYGSDSFRDLQLGQPKIINLNYYYIYI